MLRKCLFVLLAIFLKQYGPAPQVVAASLILVFALSAELQNLPYQDKEHDRIETIGIQVCLLQLQVALLCDLIRADQPDDSADEDLSASNMASLGPTSTILLIVVVFVSTLFFFVKMIRATIQGSQDTPGAVGFLARRCGDQCGKRSSEEEGGVPLDVVVSSRSQTSSRFPQTVVAPMISRQQQAPPGSSHAHVYAALKLQQNVKNALGKKLDDKKKKIDDTKAAHNFVKDIEMQHANQRKRAIKDIERRQSARRHSVQSRVQARKIAKRLNALQKSDVFSGVDSKSISKIIDTMDYVMEDSGTVICKQGDVATTLYLIMSGKCSVNIDGAVIAVLGDLELFGEGALFPPVQASGMIATRAATVIVVSEKIQLLTLSKENFDRLASSGTLDEACLKNFEALSERRAKENVEKMSAKSDLE